ncbi:MAG TPA: phosphoglucosamine mutase [Pseudonocardiaceae bacterium]|jgi:phosphoglucosamine mutase|nr:phosphoglucosamine mutase [Pseudonocardiaceae bacterium]
MTRLFGTDGVRGLANADLTPELALGLSAAAARVLAEHDLGHRPVAVVGRDPRASGEMLEAAVTAGLTSAGADVLRVGVVPTPAVAHLVSALSADLGVMISASHNPMPDNGIKLFSAGGHKLPDAVEDEISARVGAGGERPTGARIGRMRDVPQAVEGYLDHLLAATPHPLDGIRLVVDCANGAASALAPQAYQRAGADVVTLHAEPNGVNINDGCGSTHLDQVRKAVLEHGATLGIAHDGDADRCLAVDAAGEVVDGDQIMAVLALAMREAGELVADTVVATVMSNLGLHLAMRAQRIRVQTTAVGDRYVLEALTAGGYSLGGEQSGHLILPGYATTGDGLLTALRLMARMAATGRALAELAGVLTRLPQVLLNVAVTDRSAVAAAPAVAEAIAVAQAELGETGRVLLRPSGTEPVVRVMVEAPTQAEAETVARRIAAVVAAVG